MSRDETGDPAERLKPGTVRNALTSEARDRQLRHRWFRRFVFWLALGCGSWILWLLIGETKRFPLDPNLLIYCIGAGFFFAFLYGLLAASSFLLTVTRTKDSMLQQEASQAPLAAAPRQVGIRGKVLITPIMTVLVFGLPLTWFLHLVAGNYKLQRALATAGLETQGTVKRLVWSNPRSRYGGRDDPGFHNYAFEYTVAGRTFSAFSPRLAERNLPAPGSRVTVTYLPQDPRTARPIARSQISVWRSIDWIPLLAVAVGAIGWGWGLLLPAALAVRREYLIARYGEAAVGTITDLRVLAPRKRRLFGVQVDTGKTSLAAPSRLTYQFRSREGHDVWGESRKFSSEHKKGSQLTILYDPADSSRNIPLVALSYFEI